MPTDPTDQAAPPPIDPAPAAGEAPAAPAAPAVPSDPAFVRQCFPRSRGGFTKPLLKDLTAELRGLKNEWNGYKLVREPDPAPKRTYGGPYLSVTTDTITLMDVRLGPFEIYIPLDRLRTAREFDNGAVRALALEPNCAYDHGDTPHPHVRGGRICMGAGEQAIRLALFQGRLMDVFSLVKQILETYNEESPYAKLEEWVDGPSDDDDDDERYCGDCEASDPGYDCYSCGMNVCGDCTIDCEVCEDRVFCRGCARRGRLVGCVDCDVRHACSACRVDVLSVVGRTTGDFRCRPCHVKWQEAEQKKAAEAAAAPIPQLGSPSESPPRRRRRPDEPDEPAPVDRPPGVGETAVPVLLNGGDPAELGDDPFQLGGNRTHRGWA